MHGSLPNPLSSEERITLINQAIKPSRQFSCQISDMELEQLSVPEIPSNNSIRFNYNLKELMEISEKYTNNSDNDQKRVIRYALIMSGVRINSEKVRNLVRLDIGYNYNRYPRFTGAIYNKRLSIRIVPEKWKIFNPSLNTNFHIKISNSSKYLTIGETPLQRIEGVYFGSSVNVLSYITLLNNNNISITVNPLTKCSHQCRICCRGYYDMKKDFYNTLIMFDPAEFARYLMIKYKDIDFNYVKQISFITGAFDNIQQLYDYINSFINHMDQYTKGKFSPINNESQSVKVSTHLIADKIWMNAFKQLGVRQFMYTIETLDDSNRKQYMVARTDTAVEKGTVPVCDTMHILENASSIFGKQNIEPVMIIGLDTYDKTKQWLQEMQKLGYSKLTRGIYNVYNANQLKYYKMNLPELINITEYINKNFLSGYRQILTPNNSLLRKEFSQ